MQNLLSPTDHAKHKGISQSQRLHRHPLRLRPTPFPFSTDGLAHGHLHRLPSPSPSCLPMRPLPTLCSGSKERAGERRGRWSRVNHLPSRRRPPSSGGDGPTSSQQPPITTSSPGGGGGSSQRRCPDRESTSAPQRAPSGEHDNLLLLLRTPGRLLLLPHAAGCLQGERGDAKIASLVSFIGSFASEFALSLEAFPACTAAIQEAKLHLFCVGELSLNSLRGRGAVGTIATQCTLLPA